MHLRELKMKGAYTIIVPALEGKGPVNVAMDIAKAANAAGWRVRVLYLTEMRPGIHIDFAREVRKFRISDLWTTTGVVHTHCLRPDLLAFGFKWNPAVTLITTIHSFFKLDLAFEKPSLYVAIAWQLWVRAIACHHSAVCISQTMRRYYARELPGRRFDVIYNFRGHQPDSPSNSQSLKWIEMRKFAGNTVLAFVGVLSDRKNILGLIRAMSSSTSLSLIVCGDGPLKAHVDQLVSELGLEDRVRLEGQVSSPGTITRHVDALILPSFAEGFPLAVIEAAAVGIPALMSNIAVHRELEKLGFGRTFDHRRFTDLEAAAEDLRKTVAPPSSKLINLWRNNFNPHIGFQKYELLANTGSAKDVSL